MKATIQDAAHHHPVTAHGAVLSTLSDSTGRFQIVLADTGLYRLHVEAIGSQSFDTQSHILKDGDADLGILLLQSAAVAPHEVQIRGKRKTIGNEIDKLIFDVNEMTLLTPHLIFVLLTGK
ncbi:carboxypeptidase-like regulatory domain-containing protein [Thermoflavifilum aggregans]|uniref:carboxypeptidase-like regulatory domain-containing protein n=1 Tax=Thermoflavifilum aggregans TaxID=454188 RepID=UPI000C246306|nr:carboxypeptidase-like regulatory domain-containing protein [Thermoflavifilum aggregans]